MDSPYIHIRNTDVLNTDVLNTDALNTDVLGVITGFLDPVSRRMWARSHRQAQDVLHDWCDRCCLGLHRSLVETTKVFGRYASPSQFEWVVKHLPPGLFIFLKWTLAVCIAAEGWDGEVWSCNAPLLEHALFHWHLDVCRIPLARYKGATQRVEPRYFVPAERAAFRSDPQCQVLG